MSSQTNFFKKRDEENILKIRELRLELPSFCSQFFMGIEHTTTPLTRLGYARDLKIFFEFLTTNTQEFYNLEAKNFSLANLEQITSTHLEMFLDYLTVYKINKQTYRNNDRAKSRKLSSVRALLKYFFKKEKITSNVAAIVDTPKLHDKEIIRLETDEVAKLLDSIEAGAGLTKMQKSFHSHTRLRDVAMLTLFLGTGIRISECVGLNVDDIDFNNNAFTITRKGGSKVILYFSDEVAAPLKQYIAQREKIKELPKEEKALFLSLQNKRIGVRAVENLVKKFAHIVTPLKKITPHNLRTTYGTNLYRQTNDIYVVADVLGHKDVNTTRKHYAAISEDIRRNAATKVKLREEIKDSKK